MNVNLFYFSRPTRKMPQELKFVLGAHLLKLTTYLPTDDICEMDHYVNLGFTVYSEVR